MAGTSIGTHMRLFTARHAGAFVAYCDRAVSSPAKMQEVTGMLPALANRGRLDGTWATSSLSGASSRLLPIARTGPGEAVRKMDCQEHSLSEPLSTVGRPLNLRPTSTDQQCVGTSQNQCGQLLRDLAGQPGAGLGRRRVGQVLPQGFTCAYPPLAMLVPFVDYCDLVVYSP